jgi:hypothetical protein
MRLNRGVIGHKYTWASFGFARFFVAIESTGVRETD